jgi:hypothetical protein
MLARISAASLVGEGGMRIDGVAGEQFSASFAGPDDLDVAALRVDDARFSIAAQASSARARLSSV